MKIKLQKFNPDLVFKILIFLLLSILVTFFLLLISGLFNYLTLSQTQKYFSLKKIIFPIKLTLITATISALIATIFAIPVAYILSRYNFPLKNFINSLLYLPVIVSPIALGSMLLIFFNTPIGTFFEKHFFRVVFEVKGIIFAQFVVIVGVAISLTKSVFDQIDPAYEEIAITLGAKRYQTFFYNLIPMSKKGIISCFILTWAKAVSEFGATVTLAGATTMKTETLPVAIYLSFAAADVHTGIIFILITILIGIGIVLILNFLYDKNKRS